MKKSGIPTASLGNGNTGVQISASVYGKSVKLIYGLCKAAPDLIWYNGWKTLGAPSNALLNTLLGTSPGKKQAKKSGAHYYSAAMDFVLGHAPILGALSIWVNNTEFTVFQNSASGFVSGGQFSFTPSGVVFGGPIPGTIPSTPPYTISVANFVADRGVRDLTLGGNALPPPNNDGPNGTYLVRSDPTLPPGPYEYTVPSAGLYTFNAAQAGDSIDMDCFLSGTGAPATLVSIFAATCHEEFSATFNDFGAPAPETIYGTWERPLWNAAFAVPGRIDAGAYRARDPYTWWWDGVNPTANFPGALEGFPVTVYYGVPIIYKSNGDFYSSTVTPLEVLNLEFEAVLASGTEYAGYSDQQLQQAWCSGLGSPQYDLGTANTPPSLNVETIGAFTQWKNGDCDVADILADIVASGPVLVQA